MKKALCILTVLLLMLVTLPLPALGAELTDGLFTFTVENGGAVITGYTGMDADLTVPDTLGGRPVTAVGGHAFADKKDLISVTLPGGLASIGDRAFSNCTGLVSVTLKEGVASIGEYAFLGCKGLASIKLPGSVASIGEYAFFGCKGLTSITLPDSVASIGQSTFYGCGSLVSITIPEGVTSIGETAFSGCIGLASITIPDGVACIGKRAFFGCDNLISVQLSELTLVEEGAFEGCSRVCFTYYGGTASMKVLPPYKPWTTETLQTRLGVELSAFVPALPQDNACLLVADGDSYADSYTLTDHDDAFRHMVAEKSGGKLTFTQDPNQASVLVKMYVSYPIAGTYSSSSLTGFNYGSFPVTGYNCVVNLSATDMRTHMTIAMATAGEYLGSIISVFKGQTTYYANFPSLDTANVQAFVDKIVRHGSTP